MVATASTPMSGAGDRRNAATSGERRSFGERPPRSPRLCRSPGRCGACGLVILRADSAFYTRAMVTAAHEAGARFSITAPLYPSVTKANRRHRRQCVDPDPLPRRRSSTKPSKRLISDAEAAEVSFAAFRAHRHRFDDQVAGRLIVRRVRWLNPRPEAGQEELFPGCRQHAIFTDSPLPMLQTEAHHRGHAAIEQVNHGSRAACALRPPSGAAPARPLALAASVATAVHPSLRTPTPASP